MQNARIEIKVADKEDLFDLTICVDDFLDFIDNFKKRFLNKTLFILKLLYNSTLAGILVAEDKSNQIDSLEKIIPSTFLNLVYINPSFRNKHLGKYLLQNFIELQKGKGIASIYTRIPKKYMKGIKFFKVNNFQQTSSEDNWVILVLNLWNDYGIRDYSMVDDYSTCFFD
ncbi:MAG: N-acetyltransferase [Promethearchaeota archaeon]|nr:MAG: N-acetyltransferase [Candidatus Lokiarchaeota archaeon]